MQSTHVPMDQTDVATIVAALGAEHALSKRLTEWMATQASEQAQKFRKLASALSRDGTLEIDDNAVVSMGDDPGAYVLGWVWVYDPTLDEMQVDASEVTNV